MGISFSKRILFGASAVVIVIVAFLAGQNSNNSSSPSPSPVSDKSIDTDATTGVQNPSDGQVERAVSVGASPVVEGDTLFSETTTDLGQSISNNKLWWPQDTALTTTGKFVQVDLKMIDQAFGPESIAVSVSGLYDQAGRAYAYQNDYSDCGTGYPTEASQYLSPDVPCTMHLLFEVSQKSTSFTLKFYYSEK